jgi:hypothetical protein
LPYAEHEDGDMMAIIRVEQSGAAAIERTRLYLASLGESLGFIRAPDLSATEQSYAWCRARRAASRRALSFNESRRDQLIVHR